MRDLIGFRIQSWQKLKLAKAGKKRVVSVKCLLRIGLKLATVKADKSSFAIVKSLISKDFKAGKAGIYYVDRKRLASVPSTEDVCSGAGRPGARGATWLKPVGERANP